MDHSFLKNVIKQQIGVINTLLIVYLFATLRLQPY